MTAGPTYPEPLAETLSAAEAGPDEYLTERLALAGRAVRRAVAARRTHDPDPDDDFRGLYLSESETDRLLARPGLLPDATVVARADRTEQAAAEHRADWCEAAGDVVPLRALARRFGLDATDVEILLLALLPDIDTVMERLYGYLNDDVTRRRATPALVLELLGTQPADGPSRSRLAPGSPLVAGGLLTVDDAERPFLTRSLRVPDRVAEFLLGIPGPDPALRAVLRTPPEAPSPAATDLAAALAAGVRLVHVHEQAGGSAAALAATSLVLAGAPAVCVDLDALAAAPHPEGLLAVAVREARLCGGGLTVGPVDASTLTAHPERTLWLRRLARLPVPVVLTGRTGWDPNWCDESPLLVTAGPPNTSERDAQWRRALGEGPVDPALDADRELAPYRLSPEQLSRAAEVARRRAQLAGVPVDAGHLRAGARAQNAAGLQRLARRIEPAVGWDDLVLPPATVGQLGDLALRARLRDQVLGRWRMRPGGGRGRGVIALFAGDSGTGKTMSAEVVAADLGLDLYVVDLSTVVDKYVGETEKNLERIFTEAAAVNGVLLFDEADAVFGKRSEVKDAHDRYANTESAYLLQRMESFDGVAVLTTNLRANLDEAFTRRLDVIVDFPVPDAEHRRQLWDRCLGSDLPRDAGLDLDFCARFELAGGSIRACAVTAAYLAAAADRPLTTDDLVTAVRREYRKMGRLVLPSEFDRR
ncbi:ATP-binding protein [Kitasatospora sp. NPDC088346]|uniref:ATP-binding protein n=1 Tax=Kitasatospora sp. NPDC088346 TaxID=3364073 RepID=UPI00382387FD